jgi:hypothetical protein
LLLDRGTEEAAPLAAAGQCWLGEDGRGLQESAPRCGPQASALSVSCGAIYAPASGPRFLYAQRGAVGFFPFPCSLLSCFPPVCRALSHPRATWFSPS